MAKYYPHRVFSTNASGSQPACLAPARVATDAS